LFSLFQICPRPFFLKKLMSYKFFLFNFSPLNACLLIYLSIIIIIIIIIILVGLEYNRLFTILIGHVKHTALSPLPLTSRSAMILISP
jgi:hypothetical protein